MKSVAKDTELQGCQALLEEHGQGKGLVSRFYFIFTEYTIIKSALVGQITKTNKTRKKTKSAK